MFISRKTFRLRSNKNKIANSQADLESVNPIQVAPSRSRTELELVRYPVLHYLIAMLLIPTFAYLLYSANGGGNGIPGFNERMWWQYCLAGLPMLFSLLLLSLCQTESVIITKERIQFCKTVLLGLRKIEYIERDASELISVSIIKRGVEKITFTNSSYFLIFNFRALEQVEALECSSQITALDYLQQLRSCLPHLRGSARKLSIKNIVEM